MPLNPQEIWRVSNGAPTNRACARLRELAPGARTEAQTIKMCRANRIVRDEGADGNRHHPPDNAHDLRAIRGLSTGFAESKGRAGTYSKPWRAAKCLPIRPMPARRLRGAFCGGLARVMDLLKVLLKQVAEEHGVPAN